MSGLSGETSDFFLLLTSVLLCEVKMNPYWGFICSTESVRGGNTALWNKALFLLLIAATCVVRRSPPASNSSPGTFPESPTQPLSEHSQYQNHSNCKEQSPWLEDPPGHSVRFWRTASAYTFRNCLQMVADKIKQKKKEKKRKKIPSGEACAYSLSGSV